MAEYICSRCYNTHIRKKKRGSGKVEFVMWTLFPLGIPYTLWRMFSKFPVCGECESEMLVDVDSLMGQRLIQIAEENLVNNIAKRPVPEYTLPPPLDEKPRPELPGFNLHHPERRSQPRPPKNPDEW